jgi:competence protein ComEA
LSAIGRSDILTPNKTNDERRCGVTLGRSPQERGLILLLASGLVAAGLMFCRPGPPPRSNPERNEVIVLAGVRVVVPTIREPRKVNVNTADVTELTELPGIGEVLAGRIVSYRRENGPFESLDAMARVSGIGPATIEGFRERATVDDGDQ